MASLLDRTRAALKDRYAVERELGRGGMACVFFARDLRHDRPVAVKVLLPELAESLGLERFLREVQITARLSHPHILPLLDSGAFEGLLYYVMPFVDGESLRARLARDGALPVGEAVTIAREVADALGYAHARGIVHRDVKPENVLLESGHAVVADFGIARALDQASTQRLTATGLSIGTPHYMSPEQIEGRRDVDARSDVYAVGCLLYEMLVGEPPLSGPTAQIIAARRFTEPAPSPRALRVTVPPGVDAAVRRALEKTPGDRFRTATELAAELAEPSTTSVAAAPTSPRGTPRRTVALVAALVAVAAIGWEIARRQATPGNGAMESSVAVMRFVNVGGDTAQEYFVDGLAEELITSLSRVKGLQVASRTSSFAFERAQVDLREVGRKLDVASVLEGSVRRGAGRLRVSARLVSVADGYQRWSASYDRTSNDALAIQEEIAREIVAELKGELGAADRRAVDRPTAVVEAHDLFLRALSTRRLGGGSEGSMRETIRLLEAAVARDSTFARAYLELANEYAVMGWSDFSHTRDVFPKAVQAAEIALRLDPSLGPAHTVLGYVAMYYEWDFAKADAEFRRAIELTPTDGRTRQWYGNLLTAMGRFDEAEREMQQSQLYDPLRVVTRAVQGWVRIHRGDFDGALRKLEEARAFDSTSIWTDLWMGQALEAQGRTEEALLFQRRAVVRADSGAIFVAALARTHALRGERAEAQRLLARVMSSRVVPAYEVSKVHLALGDKAEAVRWLERAYDERSHSMALMKVDHELAPLRGVPAFEALMRKVGLDRV